MLELVRTIVGFSWRSFRAQSGLLDGQLLLLAHGAEPFRLWVIQVGIIVSVAGLLSLALNRIRQPKVIAEVLGGILLGPTALGRIPGFTETIFPQDSRLFLGLTANIGLCLFLFLVGLEIDLSIIKRNARPSLAVAISGMALPFGFGVLLSRPLYNHFIPPTVQYLHFMLFTGVAYSITAFPVLCRILTELKLLDTTVGIVVLSAGVGNDIVGWTLLALSVALVNAGAGVTALWILLACVAWTTFLLIPIKAVFLWLAKQTGSIENGPTLFFMTVTMMTMLGSSFVTDIIGVHAIFGAFVVGLIVPREGGLTMALTEKLEDMVAIIFLPLYFTLSGLSTNLGVLNDKVTMAFTLAIVTLAFTGKFGGCTLAAHYVARFGWRESAAIGSLMSCKGLVELIVLNVGLSEGILNQRVFSMFVFEALVLTFMTTPLVNTLYPPEIRMRIVKSAADVDDGQEGRIHDVQIPKEYIHVRKDRQRLPEDEGDYLKLKKHIEDAEKTRFSVIIDRIEHLPGAMIVTQLLNPSIGRLEADDVCDTFSLFDKSPTPVTPRAPSISASWTPRIDALRLIKLTDRVFAVMKSYNASNLLHTDPLLSIYRMFALLQGFNVHGGVGVVTEEQMVECTLERAKGFGSEMIVVPWAIQHASPTTDIFGDDGWESRVKTTQADDTRREYSDLLFGASQAESSTPYLAEANTHRFWPLLLGTSGIHSCFIRGIFSRSKIDVGLYIDHSSTLSHSHHDLSGISGLAINGLGSGRGRRRIHIFLPFIGGPHDRLALDFVVGLCRRNDRLEATVVRLKKVDQDISNGPSEGETMNVDFDATLVASRSHNLASAIVQNEIEVADDVVWARYAARQPLLSRIGSSSTVTPSSLTDNTRNISHITFKEITTTRLLHTALDEICSLQHLLSGPACKRTSDVSEAGTSVVVVAGRSQPRTAGALEAELKELMREDSLSSESGAEREMVREVQRTVGVVGSAFIGRGVGIGTWILQSSSVGR